MATHRPIAVSAWSESREPAIRHGRDPRRFCSPGLIGLVGTLILHGLALQTALLEDRAHKIPPPKIPELGSSLKETTSAESLVFIDLPKATSTDHLNAQVLHSMRAILEKTPIAVTPPEPLPPPDFATLLLEGETESEASVASADGAEHARLLGIYTGQIQARVERVWRRPRSPVNEDATPTRAVNADEPFRCQVQIVQDARGYVQEVLLPNCNGSVVWQRSLVMAIKQSSPLPAPPSPTVFSHSVTLNFNGCTYNAGSSEQEYEIEPNRVVRANAPIISSQVSAPHTLPADGAAEKAGNGPVRWLEHH